MIFSNSRINLHGNSQQTLAISTAQQTAAIDIEGLYAVWCDEGKCFIKVAATANDVTTSTGFPIFADSMVAVWIPKGYKIGGIMATGSGTLRFHKV